MFNQQLGSMAAKRLNGMTDEVVDTSAVAVIANPQFQILGAIVVPDTVLVMHRLLGRQVAADDRLHDEAMLGDVAVAPGVGMVGATLQDVAVGRPKLTSVLGADGPLAYVAVLAQSVPVSATEAERANAATAARHGASRAISLARRLVVAVTETFGEGLARAPWFAALRPEGAALLYRVVAAARVVRGTQTASLHDPVAALSGAHCGTTMSRSVIPTLARAVATIRLVVARGGLATGGAHERAHGVLRVL